jgi:hypothetical protein
MVGFSDHSVLVRYVELPEQPVKEFSTVVSIQEVVIGCFEVNTKPGFLNLSATGQRSISRIVRLPEYRITLWAYELCRASGRVMETVTGPDIGLAKRWFKHRLHSGNCIKDGGVCEGNLQCAIAACGYTGNAAASEIELRAKKRNEIVYDERVPANRPTRFFQIVVESGRRSGDPHRQDNAAPPPFVKERLQIE